MNVCLLRKVDEPGGNGPWNGMFALQQALRPRAPKWFRIGSEARDDELCWYWNWQDIDEALNRIDRGLPFVIGPNVIFGWSGDPGGGRGERALLDSPCCRAIMCHSAWYEALIRANLGPCSRALIVRWPYPISPQPAGPELAEHDVLIYEKGGGDCAGLERAIRAAYPRSVTVRYGEFRRADLLGIARRSRVCVYLCTDESGGLASSEILLAGCPVIGIERGAPFALTGITGIRLEALEAEPILAAIRSCHTFDRRKIRIVALQMFDDAMIADAVLVSLDIVRKLSSARLDEVFGGSLGFPVENFTVHGR